MSEAYTQALVAQLRGGASGPSGRNRALAKALLGFKPQPVTGQAAGYAQAATALLSGIGGVMANEQADRDDQAGQDAILNRLEGRERADQATLESLRQPGGGLGADTRQGGALPPPAAPSPAIDRGVVPGAGHAAPTPSAPAAHLAGNLPVATGNMSGTPPPGPSRPYAQAPGGDAGTGDPQQALQAVVSRLGQGSPEMAEYLRNGPAGLDPRVAAWCAATVNTALNEAGLKGTGSNVATSFANYGERVDPSQARPGDVALLSRGRPAGQTGGHVGFVSGTVPGGGIEMVAGNESNRVGRSVRPAGEVEVRRPIIGGAGQVGGVAAAPVPIGQDAVPPGMENPAMPAAAPAPARSPDAAPVADGGLDLSGMTRQMQTLRAQAGAVLMSRHPQAASIATGLRQQAADIERQMNEERRAQRDRAFQMAQQRDGQRFQQRQAAQQNEWQIQRDRNNEPMERVQLPDGRTVYLPRSQSAGQAVPPSSPQVQINQGDNAFERERGQTEAGYLNQIEQADAQAASTIRRLNQFEEALNSFTTGTGAQASITAGNIAQRIGVNPELLGRLGINPNQTASGEQVRALTTQMLTGLLGSGAFPSNNFSNADREALERSLPGLSNSPEGNRRMIAVLRANAQRDAEIGAAWRQYSRENGSGQQAFRRFREDVLPGIRGRDVLQDVLPQDAQGAGEVPLRDGGIPGPGGQGVATPPPPSIAPGLVRNGYRFRGGNPNDRNAWEPVR